MARKWVQEKWGEYEATFNPRLGPAEHLVLREAFFAGVIAFGAIIGSTRSVEVGKEVNLELEDHVREMEFVSKARRKAGSS